MYGCPLSDPHPPGAAPTLKPVSKGPFVRLAALMAYSQTFTNELLALGRIRTNIRSLPFLRYPAYAYLSARAPIAEPERIFNTHSDPMHSMPKSIADNTLQRLLIL